MSVKCGRLGVGARRPGNPRQNKNQRQRPDGILTPTDIMPNRAAPGRIADSRPDSWLVAARASDYGAFGMASSRSASQYSDRAFSGVVSGCDVCGGVASDLHAARRGSGQPSHVDVRAFFLPPVRDRP